MQLPARAGIIQLLYARVVKPAYLYTVSFLVARASGPCSWARGPCRNPGPCKATAVTQPSGYTSRLSPSAPRRVLRPPPHSPGGCQIPGASKAADISMRHAIEGVKFSRVEYSTRPRGEQRPPTRKSIYHESRPRAQPRCATHRPTHGGAQHQGAGPRGHLH